MIISFGTILMHLRVTSQAVPPDSNYRDAARFADQYEIGIGGKAALQALAAANAGAKIALVSKIGDDHYGKNMLLKLRQRGVVTSGVGRNNSVATGTCLEVGGKTRDRIIAPGASHWADASQIPEEILKPDGILMLQTEVPLKQNSILLERAKSCDTTTMMNLSPKNDLSPEDMANIDYMIVPEAYKGYVADAGKYKDMTLIVLDQHGGCMAMKAGQVVAECELPKAPEDEEGNRADLSFKYPGCSEDAFCGTFAAGLYSGMSVEKAMNFAGAARALTASKKGGYLTLPYLDAVEELYAANSG